MGLTALAHIIILIIEDIFVWIAGKLNLPVLWVIIVCLVLFYFFWRQIFGFTKLILKKLGF